MALRLRDYIVRGELYNLRNYSTHGWLQLRGCDRPVMIELTGNCGPDLKGHHFRFEASGITPEDEVRKIRLPRIAWHQIGATGDMTGARKVHLTPEPGSPMVPLLYLEWFSQNGRVVIELENASLLIEGVNWTPEPIEYEPPEETQASFDPSGDEPHKEFSIDDLFGDDFEYEDEGFGGLPNELEEALESQTRSVERALRGIQPDDEDVLHDLELMDHLITNEDGEPLGSIFQPKRLPRPEDLDDEKAESQLKALLIELALHGVAFHLCEHFTPREAYKLLIEEVIYDARVHPELRGTGWVQNFMSSDYCKACEQENEIEFREFNEKFNEEERRKKEREDEPPI